MYKRFRIILVFIFLCIACENIEKPEKPDNLIEEEEMSKILYDLYVINAAKGVNKKILESNGFVPETYILTKYNIDSLQFAMSNAYYAFNTKAYESIITKVRARLENEKKAYEELQKKEIVETQQRRDSIQKNKAKVKDTSLGKLKKGAKN